MRHHVLTIGNITCTVLNDGAPLVGERAFGLLGTVAREDVQAAYDALGIDVTTVMSSFNPLLIQAEDRTVLIDAGQGGPVGGHLHEGLQAIGVAPADIDTVFITHMHGDHFAGLFADDGERVFPNAAIALSTAEHNYISQPEILGQREDLQRAIGLMAPHLQTIAAGDALLPGVTLVAAGGHTPGHTALMIESGGDKLFDIVDSMHQPVQFAHPYWNVKFDMDPEQSVANRQEKLGRAADEDLLTLLYHMPFPGLGKVRREGDGFRWEPIG